MNFINNYYYNCNNLFNCLFLLIINCTFHMLLASKESLLPDQYNYSSEMKSIGVESSDPNDIHFYLYSSTVNFNFHQELKYNDVNSVKQSKYQPNLPIILLAHGFQQNFESSFPTIVKNAYLLEASLAKTTQKRNIICVDWGKLTSPDSNILIPILGETITTLLLYRQAVANVPIVGKRIQEFLTFLQVNHFISSEKDIHLVGHSLGAHVSGMAGFYYHDVTKTKIGRITGTDPAGPLFDEVSVNERLDATDAVFVDIIHANQGELGYVGSLGVVDFYVNGGGPSPQPGCPTSDENEAHCSHNTAFKYYAESIIYKSIKSCPCLKSKELPLLLSTSSCPDSKQITFGEFVPASAIGSYCIKMELRIMEQIYYNTTKRIIINSNKS